LETSCAEELNEKDSRINRLRENDFMVDFIRVSRFLFNTQFSTFGCRIRDKKPVIIRGFYDRIYDGLLNNFAKFVFIEILKSVFNILCLLYIQSIDIEIFMK
jgi:hypothetical protein